MEKKSNNKFLQVNDEFDEVEGPQMELFYWLYYQQEMYSPLRYHHHLMISMLVFYLEDIK